MLQLYKNIKSRRIALGMTQSELAEKAGYADKSMIAKIEKGSIDLPQSKIIAFAEILDIDPGELMGLEGVIPDNDDESHYNKIFSKNLNHYLQLYKISQAELAKRLSVSTASVSYWCKGLKAPRMDKVDLLCDIFHCSRSDLMDPMTSDLEPDSVITNLFPINLKKFPVLGEISCGVPKYAVEDRESYIMAGTDIKADFCLKAKGDSMINARIFDGDIVFIRQQDTVENGDIAAVVVNNENEALLKRLFYYQDKGLLILKPENPNYEDLIFTGEELNQVHILGKAIAFQSDVK